MKRHPALTHLSQEHHHALALCARILRAPSQNHADDIEHLRPDLLHHFEAEETMFAPFWPKLPDTAWQARFEADHAALRAMLAAPQYDDEQWNTLFAQTLRDHARFEERILFEKITEYCLSENG
ncbi:MAG: hemerythrin domain-containing protein [Neisseria sp.]|uniref:hemerythrin domain-containing protein n=1 Tax=Neisseria sp. TaxID=192066 RepID=UPI0026DCB38A|nr:hemerythrin domain-containing protein [Neisseria sp.]MDO4641150.1 hemerythrin domain-containing protein [Neisseria sp.]